MTRMNFPTMAVPLLAKLRQDFLVRPLVSPALPSVETARKWELKSVMTALRTIPWDVRVTVLVLYLDGSVQEAVI